MTLWMVRHASTALNAGDPTDPRDMFRGWVDEPLSPFGMKTGQKTANWFKGKPIDAIYSSDLTRARQMADMIGKSTGVPVQSTPLLRPWNIGNLSGQVITPELLKLSEEHQTKMPDTPLPGGESYNQFQQRYSQILNPILQEAQTKNVVVVAHHRNALALSSMLYGQPTAVKGPPDPGGVVQVTKAGIRPIYTPAEQEKVYNQHTTS